MADFSELAKALETLSDAAGDLSKIHEVAEHVERIANAQRGAALAEADELKPDRRYRYARVADFLGMAKGSVQNLSEAELPRCGGPYVMGVDIMAYRGEITYQEAEAYKRHRRRRVTARLPSTRAEA